MKPILFSPDMVRAILKDRKTVTRRAVKPQPPNAHMVLDYDEEENSFDFLCGAISDGRCIDFAYTAKAPYRPGDILYVRETWQHEFGGTYLYKASAGFDLFMNADGKLVSDIPWRPSIHMPREAARIFLRVTDVRVERLQDITDDGIVRDFDFCAEALKIMDTQQKNVACMALWDSTIKKADRDLYGWDANPWVWVIEFERISKEDAHGA